MKKEISIIEQQIGYTFKDKKLLEDALTHKTYAFEALTPIEYNERLEFLGDSILNFIIADKLYKTNSFFSEGELTRRRSHLVNNTILAEIAKELQLGSFIRLGKGEQKQQGDDNPSNLANCLEALVGAIYLDADLPTTKKVVFDILSKKDSGEKK
ncbi:MAG: ribonuclease III domain-containing protein [Candidatus Thermoplasmatota archaeon]|nr:ribonuclease III domain-containing protein [Candidatus Thermoplasmatota archaeon]